MYYAYYNFQVCNHSRVHHYIDRIPAHPKPKECVRAQLDRLREYMEDGDWVSFRRYRKRMIAAGSYRSMLPNAEVDLIYAEDPQGKKYEEDSDVGMGGLDSDVA